MLGLFRLFIYRLFLDQLLGSQLAAGLSPSLGLSLFHLLQTLELLKRYVTLLVADGLIWLPCILVDWIHIPRLLRPQVTVSQFICWFFRLVLIKAQHRFFDLIAIELLPQIL